jgi:hypothetical protein
MISCKIINSTKILDWGIALKDYVLMNFVIEHESKSCFVQKMPQQFIIHSSNYSCVMLLQFNY